MKAPSPALLAALQPPVRTRYFHGRLLTAADFEREQEYHIAARRRLTLLALGSGVVTGLRVRAPGSTVTVSPGIAIDPLGREIIVPAHVELQLDASHHRAVYVLLSYAEERIEPMPGPDPSGGSEHGAIRETYRLSLRTTRPAPDEPDAPLVIARLPARRPTRKSPRRRTPISS
jgi:hypothetical protein